MPDDLIGDLYDGKVWKDLEQNGFFDSPYNLAVTLNVDWFQPYKRVKDSVGALYLCIANLPCSLRYKQENVISFQAQRSLHLLSTHILNL